jgi:hypothetical protein
MIKSQGKESKIRKKQFKIAHSELPWTVLRVEPEICYIFFSGNSWGLYGFIDIPNSPC